MMYHIFASSVIPRFFGRAFAKDSYTCSGSPLPETPSWDYTMYIASVLGVQNRQAYTFVHLDDMSISE